jgi:hypothetical protein
VLGVDVAVAVGLGVTVAVPVGVGVIVGVPLAVGVGVGVAVDVGDAVGVGVGLGGGPDCAQYLPPVFVAIKFTLSNMPPQAIISLPVQTAV